MTSSRVIFAAALAIASVDSALAHEPSSRQRAGEVDTEHLFGQTTGSDTEEPRAFVPHLVLPLGIGRMGGTYVVGSPTLELKYGVVENFSASLSLRGLAAQVRGVPGMDNVSALGPTGVGLQGRFRLMNREMSPFGMTLQIGGSTDSRNTTTGGRGRQEQGEIRLAFDIEPVFDRWLAGANVFFGSGRQFDGGLNRWSVASTLGFGAAVSFRAGRNLWLGTEAIYVRAFSGSTLGQLEGQALFLGPTLYATFGEAWASLSFTTQVAGRATAVPGALDMANFSRHQAQFVIGRKF